MEWIPWVNNIDKYCQCLGGTGFWTGREGTVQHLTFSLFSHSFPHPGIISSAPTSMMIICHLGNDPNVSCKWSLTIHPPSFQLCQSLASFQGFKENSKYDAFFCKCVPSFFANVFLFFANMFRFFLQMCSDFFFENVFVCFSNMFRFFFANVLGFCKCVLRFQTDVKRLLSGMSPFSHHHFVFPWASRGCHIEMGEMFSWNIWQK